MLAMPDRKRQLKFRGLIAVAAALIALAVFATVLTIVGLHGDAMQDAQRDAGNIATVLAEQAERSVQAIDLTLTDLQDRIATANVATPAQFRAAFGGEATFLVLRERLAHLSQADVITLVDVDGMAINSSRVFPAPAVDLSDRDYFQRARSRDGTGIFVSMPITNRVTSAPALVFSRRLESRDGTFLGVVLINVDLEYFRHVYQSISSLTEESFLLLRRDGVVLVRYPDPKWRSPDRIPSVSPWYRTVGDGGGYYR
jgi:hypothetical protein